MNGFKKVFYILIFQNIENFLTSLRKKNSKNNLFLTLRNGITYLMNNLKNLLVMLLALNGLKVGKFMFKKTMEL
jgi:hypothetical protein